MTRAEACLSIAHAYADWGIGQGHFDARYRAYCVMAYYHKIVGA